MKYHALFLIFEKVAKFEIVVKLQIMRGALRVKFLTLCLLVSSACLFVC